MESMQGHVETVALEVRGDQAEAAASVGATSLAVYDLADFDEEGGWVRVNGTTVQYTATVGDDDTTTRTLTLATALTVAVAVDDRVDVWNPETSDVVAEWVATVVDDVDGGQIQAPIAHELIALLGEGVRGLVGESVVCTVDAAGSWTVTSVEGKTPSMDGAHIEPGTIGESTVITAPPATSPALTVVPLAESFLLRTEPIEPTTWLTYEVSTDGSTWAPLPDMPVRSTIVPARRTSDGSAFLSGTAYQFRVTAGNVRGSAAPSAATAATQLDPTVVEQVASRVIAEEVVAGFVLAGRVDVGGDTFTLTPAGVDPANLAGGMRIAQANGGLVHLPADGSTATMTGLQRIDAANMDVNGLSVRGQSKMGGSITLSASIPDPTVAPTAEAFYTEVPSSSIGQVGIRGLCRTVANDGWVYVANGAGYAGFWRVTDAGVKTNISASGAFGNPTDDAAGVTRVGSSYFVLRMGATHYDLLVFDSNFALTATYDNIVTAGSSAAIGTDGTYVVVAVEYASQTTVTRFNTNGTPYVGTGAQINISTTGSLGGVYAGSADFGGDRYVLQPKAADAKVYNTSGVIQSAQSWPLPMGLPSHGIHWDGTYFWTISHAGAIRRLESGTSAPAATYWLSYTWRDADTHSTGPSPQTEFARPRRAQIKVTASAAPQEGSAEAHAADRIQFYAATTSGGTKYPQGSTLAVSQRAAYLSSIATSGTAAPANNFASVTVPGQIAAATGGFSISGNSNGSVGTGTFRTSVIQAPHQGRASLTSDMAIGTTELILAEVTLADAKNGAVYRVMAYGNVGHSTAGATITVRTKFGASMISESILTAQVALRRYPVTPIGHFTYTGTDGALGQYIYLTAQASVAGATAYGALNGSSINLYVDRIA